MMGIATPEQELERYFEPEGSSHILKFLRFSKVGILQDRNLGEALFDRYYLAMEFCFNGTLLDLVKIIH